MTRTYRPMNEAPKDGSPIVAVCGGVEAMVCWDAPIPSMAGWYHYDDEEMGPSYERVRDEPVEWREPFGRVRK